MQMAKRAILILAMLAVLGCGSTHEFTKTSLGSAPPPRPTDCDVEVLDHMPDERVYRELGFCETKVPGGVLVANDDNKALREFKRCACEAGGNAIVVESGFMSLSEYSRSRNEARATVLLVED
jgi:hypothetical protein